MPCLRHGKMERNGKPGRAFFPRVPVVYRREGKKGTHHTVAEVHITGSPGFVGEGRFFFPCFSISTPVDSPGENTKKVTKS